MSVVVVVVEEALDIKLRTSPTKACIKEQCQMGTDQSSQVILLKNRGIAS